MNSESRKLVYLFFIFSAMISLSYVKGIPRAKRIIPLPMFTPAPIQEISIGNTDKKQVIFTFDGGSGNQSTNEILNILEKHHIHGTFFLTGEWIENNPLMTIRIHNGGHEIFSHTYSHPYLTRVTNKEIKTELEKMDKILYKLIGISSRPYFRAPYGDRDDRVKKIASDEGYQSVYWTIDAQDWLESEGETEETVTKRIIENINPGTIYLMHLGDDITGKILDNVLKKIESMNYKIVSLTEGI